MILEAISFKLATDFFVYLKKNRVIAKNIKIDFFDRVRHEFIDFTTVDEMLSYFTENYTPINNCFLGDLGAIQFFLCDSNTFNFDISYKVIDVTGNLRIIQDTPFDAQRDIQRGNIKQRQLNLINQAVKDYLAFFNEIKRIYVTGIYSPCYAEPGWSENTWLIRSLKDAFISSKSSAEFPYTNTNIQKKPPNL